MMETPRKIRRIAKQSTAETPQQGFFQHSFDRIQVAMYISRVMSMDNLIVTDFIIQYAKPIFDFLSSRYIELVNDPQTTNASLENGLFFAMLDMQLGRHQHDRTSMSPDAGPLLSGVRNVPERQFLSKLIPKLMQVSLARHDVKTHQEPYKLLKILREKPNRDLLKKWLILARWTPMIEVIQARLQQKGGPQLLVPPPTWTPKNNPNARLPLNVMNMVIAGHLTTKEIMTALPRVNHSWMVWTYSTCHLWIRHARVKLRHLYQLVPDVLQSKQSRLESLDLVLADLPDLSKATAKDDSTGSQKLTAASITFEDDAQFLVFESKVFQFAAGIRRLRLESSLISTYSDEDFARKVFDVFGRCCFKLEHLELCMPHDRTSAQCSKWFRAIQSCKAAKIRHVVMHTVASLGTFSNVVRRFASSEHKYYKSFALHLIIAPSWTVTAVGRPTLPAYQNKLARTMQELADDNKEKLPLTVTFTSQSH